MEARLLSYSPRDNEDPATRDRLLEVVPEPLPTRIGTRRSSASTTTSVSVGHKPRRMVSVCTFSLIVIGVSVMFLLGVCVGFYVRELQKGTPDPKEICTGPENSKVDYEELSSYHQTVVYYVRGEEVRKFVSDYGTADPVTGSGLEVKLSDFITREFEKNNKFDSVEVEEHDIVVTVPDPKTPNQLMIIQTNGSALHNFQLTNQKPVPAKEEESKNPSSASYANATLDEWKFPFVAFSPSGEVQGELVYGHYGRETDFRLVEALGVKVKDKIVLTRLGQGSAADKVFEAQRFGAKAVLFYWDPQDTNFTSDVPEDPGFIPYASASMYLPESPQDWRPSIPCQTVSAMQAQKLMSQLQADAETVPAPFDWHGDLQTGYSIGAIENATGSFKVKLVVYNKSVKKRIKNIIGTIQGVEETDRYIIVGAPRSAQPGTVGDIATSTSILVQLANGFHYVNKLHSWRPRRGIKIVSWGGDEFSHAGMTAHWKSCSPLIDRRIIAYVDLSQLMRGTKSIAINVVPTLHQTVKEAAFEVADPTNPELQLIARWDEINEEFMERDFPLYSYDSWEDSGPFLLSWGVPTLKAHYTGVSAGQSEVKAALQLDTQHHYKYHITASRVLTISLMMLLDNPVLPIRIQDAGRELQSVLRETSDVIRECSSNMEDLYMAKEGCKELQWVAKAFDEMTTVFKSKSDIEGLRMINDVLSLFERLFIVNNKGRPQHILHPITRGIQELGVAEEICKLEEYVEVWDLTEHLSQQLVAALRKTVMALRVTV